MLLLWHTIHVNYIRWRSSSHAHTIHHSIWLLVHWRIAIIIYWRRCRAKHRLTTTPRLNINRHLRLLLPPSCSILRLLLLWSTILRHRLLRGRRLLLRRLICVQVDIEMRAATIRRTDFGSTNWYFLFLT